MSNIEIYVVSLQPLVSVFLLWNIVVAQNDCKPKDCRDLKCYRVSKSKDGPHTIYPGRPDLTSLQVSCDQETEYGGWIIFQRRVDGSVNFTRLWADYRNGFGRQGNSTTELWLGNENVYQLLQSYGTTECELRMEAYAFDGDTFWMGCSKFKMSPESDHYRLTWDTISTMNDNSNLLRDWNYHKNQTFETSDNSSTTKCADPYKNGWWYGRCVALFLNGIYHSTPTATYSSICIVHFKDNLSLKGASMMFRPTDYTRPCNNPCKNGGTCRYVVASNGRRCECPLTYCGATCEKNNPCNNGGTCVTDVATNTTSCQCAAGFAGPSCLPSTSNTTLIMIQSSTGAKLIMISAFLLLLIVALTTAVVLFYRRKKAQEDEAVEAEKESLLAEQEELGEEPGFFDLLGW